MQRTLTGIMRFLTSSTALASRILALFSVSSTVMSTWRSSFRCSQFGFPLLASSCKSEVDSQPILEAHKLIPIIEFCKERIRSTNREFSTDKMVDSFSWFAGSHEKITKKQGPAGRMKNTLNGTSWEEFCHDVRRIECWLIFREEFAQLSWSENGMQSTVKTRGYY